MKPVLENKSESTEQKVFDDIINAHFRTLPLKEDRYDGLRICIGEDLLQKLH